MRQCTRRLGWCLIGVPCSQDSLFYMNADNTIAIAWDSCSTCSGGSHTVILVLRLKNRLNRFTYRLVLRLKNRLMCKCQISKHLLGARGLLRYSTDVVLIQLWFLYCALELRGCLHRVPRLWNCNTLREYSRSVILAVIKKSIVSWKSIAYSCRPNKDGLFCCLFCLFWSMCMTVWVNKSPMQHLWAFYGTAPKV